jgi:predicted transcriptional regulator of viral defense system
MPGPQFKVMHELAAQQHGVFTTKQAEHVGVTRDRLAKMVRAGDLVRIAYGLLRDVATPETKLTPYMAAVLWPVGVVGLLSHQTVLALLEISDVVPGRIHVTVPKRFRPRTRPLLPWMELHHADVPETERSSIEGVPATSTARAIRDCAAQHIGPALLGQALKDAQAQGWLTTNEATRLEAELMADKKL